MPIAYELATDMYYGLGVVTPYVRYFSRVPDLKRCMPLKCTGGRAIVYMECSTPHILPEAFRQASSLQHSSGFVFNGAVKLLGFPI